MAKHARPDAGALAHPARRTARQALAGAPERARLPASDGVLQRVRAVAFVVLAAVVVVGAVGVALTDEGRSASSLPTPLRHPDQSMPPPVKADPGSGRPTSAGGAITSTSPAADVSSRSFVSPPPTAGSADSPGSGWAAVLGRLDAARTAAFGLGDVGLLTTVYVDGSRPLERDRAALIALAEAGVRAVGLRLVVDEITVVRAAGEEAVLRVVDRMPGYHLVSVDGSIAELRTGRGPAAWLVTLRGGVAAWRIAAISAA